MTNGEKIQSLFPNKCPHVGFNEKYGQVWIMENSKDVANFILDWWNAEYREPTTRNCFGCKYAKDNHNSSTEECHLCMWENQYTPTTKNDLPHCHHTDKEIAKSFIEDVEAVKDQLPCGEQMDFPNTFDEFAEDYGFKDKKEIYTNGSELIPVFRVKQWLEHISTTKNNLGVDCIDRKAIEKHIEGGLNSGKYGHDAVNIMTEIHFMSSVTPQPRKGHWIECMPGGAEEWCYKCSECNFWKYKKTINLSKFKFCPNCGADMRGEE